MAVMVFVFHSFYVRIYFVIQIEQVFLFYQIYIFIIHNLCQFYVVFCAIKCKIIMFFAIFECHFENYEERDWYFTASERRGDKAVW